MPQRSWTETQILTRLAPTLVTEGMSIDNVKGLQVSLTAQSTKTLSGAGTLQCYFWNPAITVPAWVRNIDLDITVPAGSSGLTTVTFGQLAVLVPMGRILYAANAVTESGGGTTCDVRIDAY